MLLEYQLETIRKIRAKHRMFRYKNAESIANSYHHWSEINYSASWINSTDNTIDAYIDWCLCRPFDKIIDIE